MSILNVINRYSGVKGSMMQWPAVEAEPAKPISAVQVQKPSVSGARFVNFHHHDEYSLRAGIGNVSETVKIVAENGGTHLFVSNYCDVTEWVRLYSVCRKNNAIPVFGFEAYVSNYLPRRAKQGVKTILEGVEYRGADGRKVLDFSKMTSKEKSMVSINWHLVLLARTSEGYMNLIKMHNEANLEWTEKMPRCSEESLMKFGKGVVAIIPNYSGQVVFDIDSGNLDSAREKLELYRSFFDDVYIELAVEEDDFYKEVNHKVIDFCRESGVKMLVGINSHYTFKTDEDVYRQLLTLRKFKGDPQHEVNMVPDMHYKTQEEVEELFSRRFEDSVFTREVFDECLANSGELADSIPAFEINTEIKMPHFADAKNVIVKKAFDGLFDRCHADDKRYVDRLKYELDNVNRAGFTDYFLFLEDMCRWCHQNDVLLGVARGSGGGSLLLYCLKVTDLDPIKHNLLFERFLDASRLEEIISKGLKVTGGDLPDVDMDVSNKEAVHGYFRSKYGENNFCTIGTLGRYKNKSLLLDLARMNGIPLDEVYHLTKGDMSEWETDTEDMTVDELRSKSQELDEFLSRYPEIVRPWDRLRGGISSYGQHAGGVLVSDVPLTNLLPVKRIGGNIVSSWMEGLEDRELGVMGFVKMDILGIDAMSITDDCLKMINQRHGKNTTRDDIDIYDPKILKQINSGDNYGLWQLDGALGMSVIKAIGGCKIFDDLAIVSALMRPADLQNNFHHKFGDRRSGKESFSIPKPLVPYLSATYGLPIFQESAYHIGRHIAGFDIVTAYKFMKTLYKGKMKGEAVPYWHDKFCKACQPMIDAGVVDSDYPERQFNELLAFQGYGFNASHAYAYAYYTAFYAWFKTYYYPEFMCVLINHTDRLGKINEMQALLHRVNFARRVGIMAKPPRINDSGVRWTLDYDDALLMSLGDVSGVGLDAASEIASHGPYSSFDDFMLKIDRRKVMHSKIESLIFAGAFDEFGDVPTVWNYWNRKYCGKQKKQSDIEQMDFFFGADDSAEPERVFSKKELKELKAKALSGIDFDSDLVSKYGAQISAEHDIKLMQEVESSQLKFPRVFCKVVKVTSFTSRSGEQCRWVHLTDGRCTAKMYVKSSEYAMNNVSLKPGSVISVPVTVSSDNRQVYFFNNSKQTKVLGVEAD